MPYRFSMQTLQENHGTAGRRETGHGFRLNCRPSGPSYRQTYFRPKPRPDSKRPDFRLPASNWRQKLFMTHRVSLQPLQRWMFGLLALGLALAAAPHASHAQDAGGPDVSSAQAFISDLADKTINVLSADMTPGEKTAQFSTLLEDGVNTDYVSRFVLGRNWNTATPEQRDDFRRLFKEFLLANLTERLSGEYDNQSFTVKNAVPAGSKDVLVRSEIQRTSGPPLKVEWRVRQFDGQWQIIDIAAEGLSLAITQREEYGSVVQRKGMDGLLAALDEQVSQMKAGNADAELPDADDNGS